MTLRVQSAALADSLDVRARLVEALKLDLVGPWVGHAFADERLPGWIRPSNWYLTGFLIPTGTPPERRGDSDEDDDISETPAAGGPAEESNEERKAAKKGYFPSSMGLSFLVPAEAKHLNISTTWGDYAQIEFVDSDGKTVEAWQRTPRAEVVALPLSGSTDPTVHNVPNSAGLQLHVVERPLSGTALNEHIAAGSRSVSVFLVNHRTPIELGAGEPDAAYVFQPELEVRCEQPFVPRPDLRGTRAEEWDEWVSDLHYADTPEYATGHGVSAEWDAPDGACHVLRTTWIPAAQVQKTATVDVPDVELSMDALGALESGSAVLAALGPLVDRYRAWIAARTSGLVGLHGKRRETAEELLRLAGAAADRIERGIAMLARDADALDAFRVANRAVARALRQRLIEQFKHQPPHWRAFQIAFVLLNLPGLADPLDPHRNTVDLLFFPTGGGKTEAYLGLARISHSPLSNSVMWATCVC